MSVVKFFLRALPSFGLALGVSDAWSQAPYYQQPPPGYYQQGGRSGYPQQGTPRVGTSLPPRGYVIPAPGGVAPRPPVARPVGPPPNYRPPVASASARTKTATARQEVPRKSTASSSTRKKTTEKPKAVVKSSTSKEKSKAAKSGSSKATAEKSVAKSKADKTSSKSASVAKTSVKPASKVTEKPNSPLVAEAKSSPPPPKAVPVPVSPPNSLTAKVEASKAPTAKLTDITKADGPPVVLGSNPAPPAGNGSSSTQVASSAAAGVAGSAKSGSDALGRQADPDRPGEFLEAAPIVVTTARDLPADLMGSSSMLPLALEMSGPSPASVPATDTKAPPASAPAPDKPNIAKNNEPANAEANLAKKAADAPAVESTPAPVSAQSAQQKSAPVVVAQATTPVTTKSAPLTAAPAPVKPELSAETAVTVVPNVQVESMVPTVDDSKTVAAAESTVSVTMPQAKDLKAAPVEKAAPVVESLPVEDLAQDDEPPAPRVDSQQGAPSSLPPNPATSTPKSPVTVTPSLANVRNAAFQPPPAPATTDFYPAPPEPIEPPPVVTPQITPNSSLGKVTIDAERADSENDDNRVTFTGNVQVNCQKFQLRADKVFAYMKPRESGGGMQKVEAIGKVVVRMNGEGGKGFTALSNRAFFDPSAETIRLVGWPKIEEGARALVANSVETEIIIDTKTGRLTTTGGTKTVLNP